MVKCSRGLLLMVAAWASASAAAPPAQFAWVRAGTGTPLPADAFAGGFESGAPLIVCRAPYYAGLYPGKIVKGNCNISYGGYEIVLHDFDVLVGQGGQWGAARPGYAGAFIAGYEQGNPLFLCQADYRGGRHPGKIYKNQCNISYGGREIPVGQFNVLYGADTASGDFGNGQRFVYPVGPPPPSAVPYSGPGPYDGQAAYDAYVRNQGYQADLARQQAQQQRDIAARQKQTLDAQTRAAQAQTQAAQAQARAAQAQTQAAQAARDKANADAQAAQQARDKANADARAAEAARADAERQAQIKAGEAEENRMAAEAEAKAAADARAEAERQEQIRQGEAEENRMAAEAQAKADAEAKAKADADAQAAADARAEAERQEQIRQGEAEENRMAAEAQAKADDAAANPPPPQDSPQRDEPSLQSAD